MYKCMNGCMDVCMYVCMYVCNVFCMYMFILVRKKCVCKCIYVSMYICMYVCMYVCMCIWYKQNAWIERKRMHTYISGAWNTSKLLKNTGFPSRGKNCFGTALCIRFPFPPASKTTPTELTPATSALLVAWREKDPPISSIQRMIYIS